MRVLLAYDGSSGAGVAASLLGELVLERRDPPHAGHRYQHPEQEEQLGGLGYLRLKVDRRLGRIEADSQVAEDVFAYVVRGFSRRSGRVVST